MRAFIFDFDGVVVDSERYWKSLGDDVFFPSLVPSWTREHGVRMMGLGVRDAYEVLRTDYGVTICFPEYEQRLHACVGRIYDELCLPLPGLLPLLDRLEQAAMAIGIASSSQPAWIRSALTRVQLLDRFPVIVTAADVGHRAKPAPDVYLRAATLLQADPRDCIAIEDSQNGLRSAQSAGMTCIALSTDMNTDQVLDGADATVTSLDEVMPSLLTRLSARMPAD